MKITDKMLKAYFHVAEDLQMDPQMTQSASLFHRTRKVAFFVEARKLDENGLLATEKEFTKRTKKEGL